VGGAFALLLIAGAASACSTGGGNASTAPTTVVPAPGSTPPAPGPCATFRGAEAPRTSTGPTAPGLLTGATAGAVGCLDQVEFVFSSKGDGTAAGAGLAPGYDVQYVDPPFKDGDTPISIQGSAFLQVTMKPAATYDTTDPAHPTKTYTGPLLLRWNQHNHLEVVREMADTADGVVWIISLDGKRPFAVDAARDPTRITIWIG
jgi:hypothetical protein